ncbi:MAG: tetratricopeptide repeat protein [Terriglobales bacterium]
MIPDGFPFAGRHFLAGLLVCSLVAAAVAPLRGASPTGPPAQDALTRSGFEHYYDLDYDGAVTDFERALKAHPDDPFAVNHLLSAVFYRELYRVGALDTGLYSSNSFLVKKKFPFDPKVSAQVNQLTDRALLLSGQRLAKDPQDVQALYARGLSRALRAEYLALVDKAWLAALRNAIGARRDHEEVLRLAPDYADAKTIVGVHNYVAGSLPWALKAAASLVALNGNKQKGIQYLYDAANAGGETSVDARVALVLFLRREQRFEEALTLVRGLTASHPRNFLFALEEANVLKDTGHGPESAAAYRRVLALGRQGNVYYHPHLELAAFGLGEALRGEHDFASAAEAYESVRESPSADSDLVEKANLAAGEMYDLLNQRELAVKKYQAVITANAGSANAETARRYLKEPYRNP